MPVMPKKHRDMGCEYHCSKDMNRIGGRGYPVIHSGTSTYYSN